MKALAAPLLVCAAALAVPFSVSAQGADLLFLKNSPAAKFNAADFKLLRATIDKALAGPPEGPTLEWANNNTSASGTVTPVGVDGGASARPCRKLRIANSYKLIKDEGVYSFCQNKAGKWELKP